MAWTAPMSAVANAVWFASDWNTHVRDNMLETAAAKATAGSLGASVRDTALNTIAFSTIAATPVAADSTSTTVVADSNYNLPTVQVSLTLTLGPTDTPTFYYTMNVKHGNANNLMAFAPSVETAPGGWGTTPALPVSGGPGEVVYEGNPASTTLQMHGFWRPADGYFSVAGSYTIKLRVRASPGTVDIFDQALSVFNNF